MQCYHCSEISGEAQTCHANDVTHDLKCATFVGAGVCVDGHCQQNSPFSYHVSGVEKGRQYNRLMVA